MSFTDASGDTDGTVVQWLWDFGDGRFSDQQNPNHTYASNGTYPVILYVRDNGNCAAASPPEMVLITSHAPADVALTNPTNGSTVSGTITLEVTTGPGGETVLELTYWQRSNDPGLLFTHEVTSDLQVWNSGPAYTVVVSVIPVDTEIQQVTFRDTGLGVGDGRHFGRVGVTGP